MRRVVFGFAAPLAVVLLSVPACGGDAATDVGETPVSPVGAADAAGAADASSSEADAGHRRDGSFVEDELADATYPAGLITQAAELGITAIKVPEAFDGIAENRTAVTNALVAQIFGVAHLSMLSGFVFFSHQIGSFMGVWLGGYLYDRTGSYDIVWYIAIALGVAAALINLPIKEVAIARQPQPQAA